MKKNIKEKTKTNKYLKNNQTIKKQKKKNKQ